MELIITEKPSSAKKIAEAIADQKPLLKKEGQVKVYELTANGKPVTIVSAVGHLYTVAEKDKKGWKYPVFSVEWVPSSDVSKSAAFTKKYLTVIKKLAKKAKTFTIATDFDIEGEVIGYNILRLACGQNDGNRMKYSTVTKKELQDSYANKMNTLSWGQAHAGVTRHELDWYYGINLSRALTLSVKAAGGFKILSSGRVQTPALKILADREKEIKAFIPVPYWEVELHTKELSAKHVDDKFWKEEEAQKVKKQVTDTAKVSTIEKRQFQQNPPNPFDLTTLQTEAYRSFRMSPKETLSHAQDLYSAGFISYPRTSSQQLPEEIGYKDVLDKLSRLAHYATLANTLLNKKTLKPNNGKKTDPAHPAIYPTGEAPKGIKDRGLKVYDLVVRRFMATFGEAATRETVTLTLTSGGEDFSAKGTRTVEPGWHVYYGDHVKIEEQEMPTLKQDSELKVKDTQIHAKETQPPKRYTPSSIIRELEKKGLGTKATRADIVDNLFNRGYVFEKSIEVSEIGMRTVDTLEQYVPEIMDTELTKDIEEELEQIREGKTTPEQVLNHAKTHLEKVLGTFKEKEKAIGENLLAAERDTRDSRTVLGTCRGCGEGDMQIRKGKFGLFIGCTNYPDCKQTYTIPSKSMAKVAGKECPHCLFPMVSIKQGKRGFRDVCFNPECPSKDLTPEAHELKVKAGSGEMKCPDCEKDLTVRKSAYGEFIGCSAYPKCRHTIKLQTLEQAEAEKEE